MTAELWDQIATERRSFVAMLEQLDEDQWAAPSLCSEWTVRDVAAHVAMHRRAMTIPAVIRGLWHTRGLWATGGWLAQEFAKRPIPAILEELRGSIGSREHPLVVRPANARTDLVVHGQDIAVALGIDRPVPAETGIAAFHHLWGMKVPWVTSRRFAGVRLVATDADLVVGDGPEVAGRLGDLLLALTGRPAGAERLTGPVPSLT